MHLLLELTTTREQKEDNTGVSLDFFISQVLLELITLEVFDLRIKLENIKGS